LKSHWTDWVAIGLLAGVLVAAAIYDRRTQKVPNWLVYPAIGVAVFWWTICGLFLRSEVGLEDALLGFAVGFLPFAFIFAMGALGGGDVKTMGAVGAISASWHCVFSTMVYAFFVAMVMSGYVMVRKGLIKTTLKRIFDAATRRAPLDDSQTTRIPFCVAICIGGIIAGIEVMLGYQVAIGEFVGRSGL
jgi:prepilin peptidase CpaA